MNWDDTRIFLALESEKSLRRAAKVAGVDQATVSRRLASLEHALGATLFLRTPSGYVLTATGASVLESAKAMEKSANDLVRRAQGTDRKLAGDIKVTATDSLAEEYIVPAIRELQVRHPDVRVHLSISTQMASLTQRETDIAIRNVRPQNPDLVVRQLADWPVGLYASTGYLQRKGMPGDDDGFAGHDLVFYTPYLKKEGQVLVGLDAGRGRVTATANSSRVLRRLVAAGVGMAELSVPLAERDGLVRVFPTRERPGGYGVWLVTHQDLRHTARLRALIDAIAARFA
ncbi:LysR family transcriptional regulator [Achromobacter aloeverae]|uniref:LysR family transcriptional regulator n=1 Tax=Achromobacter aloeverae TaxID=1750518 RepID=A0A4Q1HES1_9BURK|nr:LysR family transcriptional regulator [Achromobacter aloeverae]RXN83823.1 LysR family transcriptional regulator [Achromobacter aloeverae]